MTVVTYNILDPKFFIKHSEVIASFLYEGILHLSDEIRLFGIDPGRIAVLELKLGNDLIETDNKHKLEAPINLGDFAKITKRFKDPEELTLIYDNISNMVTIRGKIKNKTKTFKLSTIDIDMTDIIDPIPKLLQIQYNAMFKISVNDLLDAVKDAEMFAEIFTIGIEDNNVFVCGGGVSGESKTIIETDSEIYGNEQSSYSIDRVKKMIMPLRGGDVIIMLKSDFPLSIYDKISNKSHMLYYLAPRIEEEEL